MIINGAQLHLLINHLPVFGFPLAALALLWGRFRREDNVIVFGAYLVVLIAVGTGISYFTGDGAEEVLKGLGQLPQELVHNHEEIAEKLTIGSALTGLLAILRLHVAQRVTSLKSPKAQMRLVDLILVLCIILSAVSGYTAHLGGLIHHAEIREPVK